MENALCAATVCHLSSMWTKVTVARIMMQAASQGNVQGKSKYAKAEGNAAENVADSK